MAEEDDRDGYEEWKENPDLAEIFHNLGEAFRPFFDGIELAKLGDLYAAEMQFREAVRTLLHKEFADPDKRIDLV